MIGPLLGLPIDTGKETLPPDTIQWHLSRRPAEPGLLHVRGGYFRLAMSITNRYRTSLRIIRSYASLIWSIVISSISHAMP